MRIGLHDAEQEYMKHKTFPNYALMKISAYHKARGDSVEWWSPMYHYDRVYSSKVFDFTPENLYLPPDTIRGGTGYDDIPLNQKLPPEIDAAFPDYSIYPECDYAIGYLTRGCPNHCPWCVVPEKEGGIKPYREWKQVVRPDTNKLVLMDNNILASEYGVSQLESMIGSGYAIDLNQGMDARLVNDRIAGILARLTWIRFIRFSCDQIPQIEAIERAKLWPGLSRPFGNPGKSPYTARATSCAWKSKEREAGTLKPRSKRQSDSKRCRDSRRTRNESLYRIPTLRVRNRGRVEALRNPPTADQHSGPRGGPCGNRRTGLYQRCA